ncbi:MAG: DUF6638 family protein [archaeon]
MPKLLEDAGIIRESLFHIDGDLVKNYNRCLEETVGKKTRLRSFRVDKRGESPELEKELGEHYLQNGPAHRYLIIVSPEQRNAELLHEEFSFDNDILDKLYAQHHQTIEVISKIDGLKGELDDQIINYDSVEDLLLIKYLNVELHTPSGFITAARTLKQKIEELKNDPSKLTNDDSSLVKEIFDLAQEIGDVRDYAIDKLDTNLNIDSFYTRLFDGAYIFKNVEEIKESNELKRPKKRRAYNSYTDLVNVYNHLFPHNSNKVDKSRVNKTTILYYEDTNGIQESGPKVDFIPLEDKDRVLDFLFKNDFVQFSQDRVNHRIERLSDLHLVELGYAIANMSDQEKQRTIYENRNKDSIYKKMRKDVKKIKNEITKGHSFEETLNEVSIENKFALLKVKVDEPFIRKMVNNLISTYIPEAYELSYKHNRSGLETVFKEASKNHKEYIVEVLKNIK